MLYHILHSLLVISCVTFILSSASMRYDHLKLRDIAFRKGKSGEAYCGKLLDRYGGIDRIENLTMGNEADQSTAEIDFVVNCSTHLTVVEAKAWSGVISGSVDSEFWSILSPSGTRTFRKNPILQVTRHTDFLSHVQSIPRERFQFAVVMTGDVVFADDFDTAPLAGIVFCKETIPAIRNVLLPWRGATNGQWVLPFWHTLVNYAYSEDQGKWQALHAKKIRKRRIITPAWACMFAFSLLLLSVGSHVIADMFSMQQ